MIGVCCAFFTSQGVLQMDVKLNFINRSNDTNNAQVVIFQKNVETGFDELAVAWKVIQYCGRGDHHPFVFPMEMSIAASDSYGNYTPQMSAMNGQLFHMTLTSSGNVLSLAGAGKSPHEVACRNDLLRGVISVGIYKDGKLLAQKSPVAPGQEAVFSFKPTLFIGVASQAVQGKVMDSAIMSSVNTEISLLGISSADIVMTGGGTGANATPFVFELENVVYA